MPTVYCSKSGCGYKNEYAAIRPIKCGKCDTPFVSAFKVEPIITKTVVKKAVPLVKKPHAFARFKRIDNESVEEVSSEDTHALIPEEEENEDYDKEESQSLAQELLASISPDDVVISRRDSSNHVNLMDVFNANRK